VELFSRKERKGMMSDFPVRELFLDRVLILPDEPPDRVGSILLPDQAKDKPTRGTVIMVGPGKLDSHGVPLPMHVKMGDRVLFGMWEGTNIELSYQGVTTTFKVLPQDGIILALHE
jgi:chaperonin GroES